jgi:hypothetical protein
VCHGRLSSWAGGHRLKVARDRITTVEQHDSGAFLAECWQAITEDDLDEEAATTSATSIRSAHGGPASRPL